MDHECGSCGEQGCTGVCRAAAPQDIVVRLRAEMDSDAAWRGLLTVVGELHGLIKRQAAEIERLRAALREIVAATHEYGDWAYTAQRQKSIALAALGEDGA